MCNSNHICNQKPSTTFLYSDRATYARVLHTYNLHIFALDLITSTQQKSTLNNTIRSRRVTVSIFNFVPSRGLLVYILYTTLWIYGHSAIVRRLRRAHFDFFWFFIYSLRRVFAQSIECSSVRAYTRTTMLSHLSAYARDQAYNFQRVIECVVRTRISAAHLKLRSPVSFFTAL